MKPIKTNKNIVIWIVSSFVLLLIIFWAVRCIMAFSNVSDPRSSVDVERQDWYEVQMKGTPVLYFAATDRKKPFSAMTENRDSAIYRTVAHGRWVNRHWLLPVSGGRIAIAIDTISQPDADPRTVLATNLKHAEKRISDLNAMLEEMDYYFSVHSVRDEGYELVTDYHARTTREMARIKAVTAKLKACLASNQLNIVRRAVYRAHYKNESGRLVADTCRVERVDVPRLPKGIFHRYTTIMRLTSRRTPDCIATVAFRNAGSLGLKTTDMPVAKTEEKPLDGFGLKVTPEKGVQVGEWKDGRFRGEHMELSSHRIFGIDISRFQHEKGRKVYRINWDRLRITSLGTISKKKVAGTVDYPVSFVYIKATEGTTIRNKYYADDYRQAKRRGIHVGNYHFFSTRSPALAQAQWYLKNSRYRRGDLPPALDVEPSDAQISRMGGPDELFKAVRIWLKEVERKTGCRPILYISQAFVNRYLPLAPDLKRDYEVWIARYGEYKPDVRMLYWQLSPDGRVKGITPQVDINVFNGYGEKYKEFIRTLNAPDKNNESN